MKVLKKIGIGIIVLLVLLAVIGFILPRQYKVERSAVIQAPTDVVFDQVSDLKKAQAWDPWREKDPTMTVSFGSITAGKGATSSWDSKKMGQGSQTIADLTQNQTIAMDLDFKQRGTAKVNWSFAQDGDNVKVTQTMTGDMGGNPFAHYMGMMMDKMIGPVFEKGLTSLKQVSETRAAEVKAQEAATRQASAPPADEAPAPAKGK